MAAIINNTIGFCLNNTWFSNVLGQLNFGECTRSVSVGTINNNKRRISAYLASESSLPIADNAMSDDSSHELRPGPRCDQSPAHLGWHVRPHLKNIFVRLSNIPMSFDQILILIEHCPVNRPRPSDPWHYLSPFIWLPRAHIHRHHRQIPCTWGSVYRYREIVSFG